MSSKVQVVNESAYTISVTGKKELIEKIGSCRATCTNPKWGLVTDMNEPLAIDTEFQEFKVAGAPKWAHRMGRMAVVNTRGQVVYDVYVQYEYEKDTRTKMPPPEYGVTRPDLWLRNGAKESWEVEGNLNMLTSDPYSSSRHGMRLDILAVGDNVWGEEHKDPEKDLIYDTQRFYGKKKLCYLAADYLEGTFNFHDPTEDARVAMLLYLRLNPYKGRDSFGDPPYQLKDEEEFPSLK